MRLVPSIRRTTYFHLIIAFLLSSSGVLLIDNLILKKAIDRKIKEIKVNEYTRTKADMKNRLWLITSFIRSQKLSRNHPLPLLKKQVLQLIRFNRFPDGQYLFAGTRQGKLLTTTYYKHKLPILSGFLNKKSIDKLLLTSKNNSLFLTYEIQKNPQAAKEKKISYIKWFPPLNIFIGTGEYINQIEKQITLKSAPFRKQRRVIRPLLWLILTAISLVSTLFLNILIRKIVRDFNLLHNYLRRVNINMSPINTRKLSFREFKALAMDANWMTRKLRRFTLNLEKMLDEKGLLLKEIHHRVKNNFQIVSSILSIQGAQLQNPEFSDILDKCDKRIRSLALAHEKIYNSTDFTNVNFDEYASTLLLMLTQSHPEHNGRVVFDIEETPLPLSLEKAIPCALILNELAENAFQHAFSRCRTGSINIHFTKPEDSDKKEQSITVSDTGDGLPADVDPYTTETLGFTLVRLLTSQLRGEITISRNRGTTITITFPK